MANPNKIKHGGSGTKLGNFLRNVVNSPNTLSPYKPKTTTNTVAPLVTASTYKPPLSTPLPNMTPLPVFQGPQLTGGQSMVNQQLMTPVPTNQSLQSSNLSNINTNTGGNYNPSNIYQSEQYSSDESSRNTPIGEVFGGSDYSSAGNVFRDYMSGGDIVDSSSIRSRAIADVQDRINALNQVYDSQLARVKQEGLGRTGETTALLAARGLAGSGRGNAIAEGTRQQNRDIAGNVDIERNNAIQGILADANKAATEEIKAKTDARLQGATALISFLKGQDERKSGFIASVAQNLIASGVDPSNMTPEEMRNLEQIARKAGVSVQNIVAAYQDAAYKANQGDGFSLSSGQARYDASGNLIAQNEGAVGGEVSAEVLALAKQVNDGAVSIQQVPSALRGAVALAQQSMSNPRVQELDAVISTIDELASNPKLKNILGPVDQAIGGVFGKAATAKNLYNQLTGILALEGRNKLKGSGAISDFEFGVLKEAQSALGRNLNEQEFKKQLEKVRIVLEKRKQTLMGSSISSDVTSTGGGIFAESW